MYKFPTAKKMKLYPTLLIVKKLRGLNYCLFTKTNITLILILEKALNVLNSCFHYSFINTFIGAP